MKIISTKKAPAAVGPYSQGIKVGDFVFTSGQLSLDPETGKLVDEIKAATLRSLTNVEEILKEAGSDRTKIVKVNIFLADINDFAAVNEVYTEFFGEHKPARSCVEVACLPMNGLIEIEAIAKA
ncbi:MAG: RidA family protein [Tissierellia bacterium]|nr:RidA family protein [Tissierellia bacterium]